MIKFYTQVFRDNFIIIEVEVFKTLVLLKYFRRELVKAPFCSQTHRSDSAGLVRGPASPGRL